MIVMLVNFSPLNDGSGKNRQEADIIGHGKAWIATNGRTIKGTWRKNKINGPTKFFDADGNEVDSRSVRPSSMSSTPARK